MRRFTIVLGCVSILFGGEYYYMNGGKRIELTPVENDVSALRSFQNTLKFKDPKGRDVAIPNRLLVKFKNTENLEKYLEMYAMRIVRKFHNNTYLMETVSPQAAIESANALSEKPDVVYAQPDLIKKWRLR